MNSHQIAEACEIFESVWGCRFGPEQIRALQRQLRPLVLSVREVREINADLHAKLDGTYRRNRVRLYDALRKRSGQNRYAFGAEEHADLEAADAQRLADLSTILGHASEFEDILGDYLTRCSNREGEQYNHIVSIERGKGNATMDLDELVMRHAGLRKHAAETLRERHGEGAAA